jgi:hypothetical protein
MTSRPRVVTFRPDADILHAMEDVRDVDGVPYSEQIRRALRAWLESRGALDKRTARKRVSSRKQV